MAPPLARLTPTLSALLGVEAPALSLEGPLPEVLAAADEKIGRGRVARCLVYCPDALGTEGGIACSSAS